MSPHANLCMAVPGLLTVSGACLTSIVMRALNIQAVCRETLHSAQSGSGSCEPSFHRKLPLSIIMQTYLLNMDTIVHVRNVGSCLVHCSHQPTPRYHARAMNEQADPYMR